MIIGAVVVVFLGGLVLCGGGAAYFLLKGPKTGTFAAKPTTKLTVGELARDWKVNPIAFRSSMSEKTMEVTGYVYKTFTIELTQTVVVLASKPKLEHSSLDELVYMHFTNEKTLAKMKDYPVGSIVTMQASFPLQTDNGVPCHLIADDVLPPGLQTPTSLPGQLPSSAAQNEDSPESRNLKGIQVSRPAGSFVIRGECEMTTDFYYEFRDAKETHYSMRLTQHTPFATTHCYVPRDSDTGKQLFQVLGKGEKAILTLECEFVGGHTDIMRIVRLVDQQKENEQKQRAAQEVERAKALSERTTEQWIEIIRQGDQRNSAEARTELVRRGKAAVPTLRASIRDKDDRVRKTVIEVLAEMGEPARDSITEIISATDDQERSVRIAAIRAIQRFGPNARSALPKLLELSVADDTTVREASLSALESVGAPQKADSRAVAELLRNPKYAGLRQELIKSIQLTKPEAGLLVEWMSPLLADKSADVRRQAAMALVSIGPSGHAQLFPILFPLLKDSNRAVSEYAQSTLSLIGKPTTAELPLLRAGVHDASIPMKLFSIKAIGDLGAQNLFADIRGLLRDQNSEVRLATAEAIAKIGKIDQGVVEGLQEAAADKDSAVRCAVLTAMSKAGRDRTVLATLYSALLDDDKDVRTVALQSLRGISSTFQNEDLVSLEVAGKSTHLAVRQFAVEGLASIAPEPYKHLDTFITLLGDQDETIRRWACKGVGAHGQKARHAAEPLVKCFTACLQSDGKVNQELITEGATSLQKIGETSKLVEALQSGLKAKNGVTRIECAKICSGLGEAGKPAMPELVTLLFDKETHDAGADVLVKNGKLAVPALLAAFDKGNDQRKIAVTDILGRIGPDASDAIGRLVSVIRTTKKDTPLKKAASENLKKIQGR
jgi:HEAT repeat protein